MHEFLVPQSQEPTGCNERTVSSHNYNKSTPDLSTCICTYARDNTNETSFCVQWEQSSMVLISIFGTHWSKSLVLLICNAWSFLPHKMSVGTLTVEGIRRVSFLVRFLINTQWWGKKQKQYMQVIMHEPHHGAIPIDHACKGTRHANTSSQNWQLIFIEDLSTIRQALQHNSEALGTRQEIQLW